MRLTGSQFVLPRLAAAPSSPSTGQVYWNTSNDTLYVYKAGGWTALASGSSSTGARTLDAGGVIASTYSFDTQGAAIAALTNATLAADTTITLTNLASSFQEITIVGKQNGTGNWKLYINDGSGAVQVPISSVANGYFVVRIDWDGTNALTSTDGGIIGAASSSTVFTVDSTFGNGVLDATSAIQSALNSANSVGGGRVYIPDGVFRITSALLIYSNTTLELAPRTTIKRAGSFDNMLRNGSDGSTGGYLAHSNIEVYGGTWDGAGDVYASNVCVIAFGHCSYIKVHDTTVKNYYGWHGIELNATQHAVVRNVIVRDLDAVTASKEHLQLDLALDSSAFPWFGPYDNTTCDDILVQGCTFVNGSRGFGSHSAFLGKWHTNVRVIGCHFDNFREQAIYLDTYNNLTIVGNTFNDCWKGILNNIGVAQINKDWVIADNVMTNPKATSGARGIQLSGANVTNRWLNSVTIKGNTVRGCLSHGVGTDYANGVVMIGNQVYDCGGTGIWGYQSRNVVISGNVARNNAVSGTNADINVGATSGTATDTQDVIVTSNSAAVFRIANMVTRAIIGNNIADTSITQASAPAPVGINLEGNIVAGVYTA